MPRSSPAGRQRTPTSPPLTADARPLLAPDVTFESTADQAVWIAMRHGVPTSRVSRTVVDLLTAMDGEMELRDLHPRFAPSDSWESFLHLIERFRASGLLDGDTRRPPGRLTFRPPFTLQVATLRAPAIFARLDRMLVPLSHRVVLVSMAILLCLGLLAAAVQARELLDVLTMPVPLTALIVLVAALAFLTVLHESAHGLTLTRFGGRPRRAGFMLFYLTPAFFVDVTDGWRLHAPRQRAAVALAGPAVHAVVAALALLVALVVPHPAVRQTLLLLAVSCVAIVLINLIPFVRFDGYIALMSALDEPNLRVRTIRDGGSFLTRFLFGERRTSRALDTWWSVPFGLASLIAPVVLVSFAVIRANRALAGGGPLLGLLVVALESVVVLVGVVLVARALLRVVRSGVSLLRVVSVCAVVAVGIAGAGAAIRVPLTHTLGFVTRNDRVLLVHAGGDAGSEVPEGAQVVLTSGGILADERVGAGTAGPRRSESTTVPLDALFPVKAGGASVPAMIVAEVDVSEGGGSVPSSGRARIEIGERNLWQTLWEIGVTLPLSIPQSDEEE